jgi:hypothetical protein
MLMEDGPTGKGKTGFQTQNVEESDYCKCSLAHS